MDNTSQTITVICFSPTHTSRAIAGAVADGMARTRCGAGATASCPSIVRTLDLTLDRSDEPIILTSGETVVLGAPVYAGRVAPEAVRRPGPLAGPHPVRRRSLHRRAQLQHSRDAYCRRTPRLHGPGRCQHLRRRVRPQTGRPWSIRTFPHQGKPSVQRTIPSGVLPCSRTSLRFRYGCRPSSTFRRHCKSRQTCRSSRTRDRRRLPALR